MGNTSQPVSPENKRLAQYIAEAFGGTPHVNRYDHDTEPLSVSILHSADRPSAGITSYSTIRLSDYSMFRGDKEFPTRIEIAGACKTNERNFPNVLAAAAFCIMRTKKFCHPGGVFSGYVREFIKATTVPHLYFTTPFLWEQKLKTLELPTKTVTWVLAMGISEEEFNYLDEKGAESLETAFEEQQIDIFDLKRRSVI